MIARSIFNPDLVLALTLTLNFYVVLSQCPFCVKKGIYLNQNML